MKPSEKLILEMIERTPGIKGMELVPRVVQETAGLLDEDWPQVLEDMVERRMIREVEYVEPATPFRAKSIYFPVKTIMMLTPPTLLALAQRNRRRRERKADATPGPWISEIPGHDDAHMCRFHTTHEPGFYLQLGCTWHPEILVSYVSLDRAECAANATFIAEARNDPVEDDIDLLLAEVRRLRGE